MAIKSSSEAGSHTNTNKKRRIKKMLFLVFRKYDPKDIDEVQARGMEFVKEVKQDPEKFGVPMRLQDGTAASFDIIGEYKGVLLVDANEEQMQTVVSFWAPLLTLNFIPIKQTFGAKQV